MLMLMTFHLNLWKLDKRSLQKAIYATQENIDVYCGIFSEAEAQASRGACLVGDGRQWKRERRARPQASGSNQQDMAACLETQALGTSAFEGAPQAMSRHGLPPSRRNSLAPSTPERAA
jgi:hypothetical protein